MRGAIGTAFALIILQVALSTPLFGLAGAAAAPAAWARAWMDPTVPLIPGSAPVAASTGQGGLHQVNTNLPPGPVKTTGPGKRPA